jgi:hypothetical protein
MRTRLGVPASNMLHSNGCKAPDRCLNKDLETCTADEAMTRIGLLRQEESCLLARYIFTRAYLSLKRTGVSEILLFI